MPNISWHFVIEFGLEAPSPFNYYHRSFSMMRLFCLWLISQMVSSCRWPSDSIWKFDWWCLSISRSNSLPWCFHCWLSTNMYRRLEHVVQGNGFIFHKFLYIEHLKYVLGYLGGKDDNKNREGEKWLKIWGFSFFLLVWSVKYFHSPTFLSVFFLFFRIIKQYLITNQYFNVNNISINKTRENIKRNLFISYSKKKSHVQRSSHWVRPWVIQ